MSFIPETPKESVKVPFFDDVTSEDGWQGHTTSKSIESLQKEITTAIVRLGGIVTGFQRGMFNVDKQKREGFQIHYCIKMPDKRMIPGRLDVAALPVKDNWRTRDHREEQSLRMSLFMVRNAVEGMWFLQQLSPGFAPLMPFMLVDGETTISQKWAESSIMHNLLPPPEAEFVEAEVVSA